MKILKKKEDTQLNVLKEEIIQIVELQNDNDEDSIKFFMNQIKVVSLNLIHKLYAIDIVRQLVQPPKAKKQYSEFIKSICFTTGHNMIQIFISEYKIAEVLLINFDMILRESTTKDKRYKVQLYKESNIYILDIILEKSRVKKLKDYSKKIKVYSV
jgi:hypothetical protein